VIRPVNNSREIERVKELCIIDIEDDCVLVLPYMDKVKSIVETFLRDDEGLFDDEPKDLDALRATVRIAGDFHDFLNKWGSAPPKEEVEYMVGTIRSGIDFFFSMMFLYRILDTSRAKRTFSWEATTEFARIRQLFLSMFDTLASEDLEFTERLACLLILTKIELVFLASNFLADGQLA